MGSAERGSFAELTVAPADKLVRKPERLTFEQAAAVPVSGTTAIQALRDKGHVRPGTVGAGDRRRLAAWARSRCRSPRPWARR